MGSGLLTDHRSELVAQAEAYLEELRAATAAAQDRLRAGIMRLHPQPHDDEPVPERFERSIEDPIFATREFYVPPEAIGKIETT